MSTDLSVNRFSTFADFELVIGDRSWRVAQVARDFIMLDRPEAIPPGPAVLFIRVDGEEIRRDIEILPATDPKSRRVAIARP